MVSEHTIYIRTQEQERIKKGEKCENCSVKDAVIKKWKDESRLIQSSFADLTVSHEQLVNQNELLQQALNKQQGEEQVLKQKILSLEAKLTAAKRDKRVLANNKLNASANSKINTNANSNSNECQALKQYDIRLNMFRETLNHLLAVDKNTDILLNPFQSIHGDDDSYNNNNRLDSRNTNGAANGDNSGDCQLICAKSFGVGMSDETNGNINTNRNTNIRASFATVSIWDHQRLGGRWKERRGTWDKTDKADKRGKSRRKSRSNSNSNSDLNRKEMEMEMMYKRPNFVRSKKLQDIWDLIQDDFEILHLPVLRIDHESSAFDRMLQIDKKSNIDGCIQVCYQSILNFINVNDEKAYLMNPKLSVGTILHDSGNSSSSNDNNVANRVLYQSECVEIYKIDESNNDVITGLIGQCGLRATVDIPKFTTIGQYFGSEMLGYQYNTQYPNNEALYFKSALYAFEVNFLSRYDENGNDISNDYDYTCDNTNNHDNDNDNDDDDDHCDDIDAEMNSRSKSNGKDSSDFEELEILNVFKSSSDDSPKNNNASTKKDENKNNDDNDNDNVVIEIEDIDINVGKPNQHKKSSNSYHDLRKSSHKYGKSGRKRSKTESWDNHVNKKDKDRDNRRKRRRISGSGSKSKSANNYNEAKIARELEIAMNINLGLNNNDTCDGQTMSSYTIDRMKQDLKSFFIDPTHGTNILADRKHKRSKVNSKKLNDRSSCECDRPLVTYVNDCRSNIFDTVISESDLQRYNIDYIAAEVNGWPMIFLVTIKDVEKGEAFWGHYEDQYCTTMKQQTRFQAKKDFKDVIIKLAQTTEIEKNFAN